MKNDLIDEIWDVNTKIHEEEINKYHTVYIDPPWNETGGGRIKRGADKHYPTMATKEIIVLLNKEILPKLKENCHLYLWVTNNYLRDGLKVIEEMGFRYVTMITWMKDRFGLGQYFRGKTEHCLFAVKGRQSYKEESGKRQQGVTGFMADRREHSKKPEEMVEMIKKVSYPPFLEVFARTQREGWTVWGNEVCEEKQRDPEQQRDLVEFK